MINGDYRFNVGVTRFSGSATKSDSLSTDCHTSDVRFQMDASENATAPSPQRCADDVPAFPITISNGSFRYFNQGVIVIRKGHVRRMQLLVDVGNGL